jgi:predicted XRE-type DNA-binding protein
VTRNIPLRVFLNWDIPMRIMVRATASKAKARDISRGSGNVFADLGFSDAEERQTRLRLAYALNTILDEKHLAQAAAAARLGLNQPKVSALPPSPFALRRTSRA